MEDQITQPIEQKPEASNGVQSAEPKMFALPEPVLNNLFNLLTSLPWKTVNGLIAEIEKSMVEVKKA